MTGDTWVQVVERLETSVDQMVRFQSELVACPALGPDNGGRGEAEKAALVEAWLKKMNPDQILHVDAPDHRVPGGRRPNLIALFQGRGQGRVWVLSHLDVVPDGGRSLWDSDPFVLRRDGDRIHGRGVEDNHQAIVTSLFAVQALRDAGLKPAADVGLIFVSDEETGSAYGLAHVLGERPDLFTPADLIIVPDTGQPDGAMVEIAEKSILWLKFTVTGRQCHASRPHLGLNTLRASARMICALDEALPRAFGERNDLFLVPASTFEPTKKEANVANVNTIPGEDVFYFDSRLLPNYDLARVKAEFERVVRETAAASAVTVKIEPVQELQAPPATPADAPVVRALVKAIAAVHGREAHPRGVGGGTVAAFFRKKSLPAAVWSTLAGTAHMPNEFALLSNHLADAKIMAYVYLRLDQG
ncbi:MAG: M20 family metallo-hydrolase [Thermodesulfobacteriota bacterium]